MNGIAPGVEVYCYDERPEHGGKPLRRATCTGLQKLPHGGGANVWLQGHQRPFSIFYLRACKLVDAELEAAGKPLPLCAKPPKRIGITSRRDIAWILGRLARPAGDSARRRRERPDAPRREQGAPGPSVLRAEQKQRRTYPI